MDNEFTARLNKEGMRGVAQYLQTILKALKDIKEELQSLKKKQKPLDGDSVDGQSGTELAKTEDKPNA